MSLLTFFSRSGNGSHRFPNAFGHSSNWTWKAVACLAGMATSFAGMVHADQSAAARKSAFVFAQSKDVELPEDFLVRVEGNKLQVALESLGIIDARRPTANLLVRLLDSNGVEKTATSNAQGIAEFSDVQADELHALVVAEKNVHAVIPLMTVSEEKATEKGIVASRIRLPVMEANRQEILASISRDIPPQTDVTGSLYALDDYQLQGLNLYQVRLQSDGVLLGRVIVADRDLAEKLRYAKLTFFRNQQVVGRTDSNPADGSFSIDGLATGIHGVVAAGPAGYTAFAFDVLPPVVGPGGPGESVLGLPVSLVESNPSDRLYVFLCPPRLVPQITDRIREAFPVETAVTEQQPVAMQSGFGGGGFGGGGFGGGGEGGGIGGGGFGGLAGLAAIAAIIASDSNDGTTSVVVSPIVVP